MARGLPGCHRQRRPSGETPCSQASHRRKRKHTMASDAAHAATSPWEGLPRASAGLLLREPDRTRDSERACDAAQALEEASDPRTHAVALRTLHAVLTASEPPPPAAQCQAWSARMLQALQRASAAGSDANMPPKDVLSLQVH